jgi:hypothetical protein
MTSFGLVKLKQIKKMLRKCADGYSIETKTHAYWVSWRGRTFRTLPRNQHSKKEEVEIGHIRSMVRHLEVDKDCAKQHIRALA